MTAVQQNIKQRHKIDADVTVIEESFKVTHGHLPSSYTQMLYSMHFLSRAQSSAVYCASRFGQKGLLRCFNDGAHC
jgi:hypothetical protein